MNRCHCCLQAIETGEEYHGSCLRKLFGKKRIPKIPFDSSQLPEEYRKAAGKMSSISGVQAKLLVRVNKKFEIEVVYERGSTHILKPTPEDYPQLAENENLCMSIAQLLDFNVPPHGIFKLADGKYCYLVKRFDRGSAGEKLHQEDMGQILGKHGENKYKASLESIGKQILNCSTAPALDAIAFFERVLLTFILGNGDMHAKNWSLLSPAAGETRLAPCYDILSSKIYLAEEEETALALNGKKNKLERSDFEALAKYLGIEDKAMKNSFDTILARRDEMLKMAEDSGLEKLYLAELKGLIMLRCGKIEGPTKEFEIKKNFGPNEYKESLLKQLDTIYESLSKTKTLAGIFDLEWRDTIENEINSADLSYSFRSEKAIMFFALLHYLRGAPWFEKAQHLVQEGKSDQLSDEGRFALAFLGQDPLKSFLPVLSERLDAFARFSAPKKETITKKLNELRRNRYSANLLSHLFECSVLGFFARERILKDIEVPMNSKGSTVDGLIDLDGRPILVEITYTYQEILSREPGVHAGDISALIGQIVHKIRKKVADERQLALSKKSPSVLVIGMNPLGADDVTAKWGIEEVFADPNFAKLSGIILSDSWKFLKTDFHEAPSPEVPLSDAQRATLKTWFGRIGQRSVSA